jgi:putative two-component system response regulator
VLLVYYHTLFILSVLLTLVYAFMWHKHFDVNFSLMFGFIPVANLGHLMLALSDNYESAINANRVIYLGGCFPLLFVTLSVLSLCKLRPSRTITAAMLSLCTVVYVSSLSLNGGTFFYKSVDFEVVDGVGKLTNKVYGPMHTVFYLMIFAYFSISIAAMIYSYFMKKDVSHRIIYMLFLPELISVIGFFGNRMFTDTIELVPLTYVTAQIIYLIIIHRICLYDIDETVVDSLVQTGDTGFISFDQKYRYLGSNETAKNIFPDLRSLTVDKPLERGGVFEESILLWLDRFRTDPKNDKNYYSSPNKKIYLVSTNYLYNGSHRRGYQMLVTDDTKNQEYITLLGRYNTDLRREVAVKTKNIVEMHDKLILGMATMVESRDNSTGGHIKRTSDVVRILVEEIQNGPGLSLTKSFCTKLVKAAPMHDLGKIAVDDAILRKPGRFTDEEYEKMKAHAAEGARIVHAILDGTDDEEFHIIAENVAQYHHERWDGSGYPQGLKGEQIPLEARIMAIADVYDALVSKRVYKEKMSFEQADSIIMDGMGKHFDKQLEPFYVAARPRLEAYYSALE